MTLFDRFKKGFKSAFVWMSRGPIARIIINPGSLRQSTVETDPAGGYAGFAYAAISKRCKRIAAINLKLYKMSGSNNDISEVYDSEVLALLYRANPMQSSYRFFYTIELMLSIWGSAPVYKERSGRRIINLWPLRPDLMTANSDNNGKVTSYTYRVKGMTQTFNAMDILMINEPNPHDFLMGMSAMAAAGLEVDADMAAAIWNKSLLDNFAEPGFVLSTDNVLADKTFNRLKAQWNNRHAGPHNAGREAILEAGLKPTIIGRSPQEMDLVETRKFNRDAITTIIGVPISLITGDANLANAEVGERVFARDTIDPEMRLITSELNEFLIPEFDVNLYLDYASPIPDDITNKVALAGAGEGRFLTPNDCRRLFQGSFGLSFPDMVGGDAIYKPIGVYPMVEGEKAHGQAKSYEKIEMKAGKGEDPRISEIRQKILARTKIKRTIIEGVSKKVAGAIAMQFKDAKGPIIAKFSTGVKASLKTDDELELDPRIKADRLEYLKSLDSQRKKFTIQLKNYFLDQKKIVLDNLAEYGQPKGRSRVSKKMDFGNWFNQIVFPKKDQDDLLVEISGSMYRDNIKQGAEAIKKLLGLSPDTDVLTTPFVVDFIHDRSFNLLEVNKTTKDSLRATLQEGVAKGESLGELRDRVSAVYDEAQGFRAETITRTEVGSAQNFGRNAEMKSQQIENKMWVSIFANSRESHMAANGQVVGVGDSFLVGGESLAYPGDPSGSTENTINCQCSVVPTLREKT